MKWGTRYGADFVNRLYSAVQRNTNRQTQLICLTDDKTVTGDVLFLDLDLVISGSLDEMFDYEPGRFCVIENWTQMGKKIGNTSCFRWNVGREKQRTWYFGRRSGARVLNIRSSQNGP